MSSEFGVRGYPTIKLWVHYQHSNMNAQSHQHTNRTITATHHQTHNRTTASALRKLKLCCLTKWVTTRTTTFLLKLQRCNIESLRCSHILKWIQYDRKTVGLVYNRILCCEIWWSCCFIFVCCHLSASVKRVYPIPQNKLQFPRGTPMPAILPPPPRCSCFGDVCFWLALCSYVVMMAELSASRRTGSS